MGATDCYFRVKGKTPEAIRKEFWNKVKEVALDVSDDDLGYSGTAAEFTHLQFTGLTFDSIEQMQDWLAPKEKNTAFVINVKDITDTPTIVKWIAEARQLQNSIKHGMQPGEAQRIRKNISRIQEKIRIARARKAEKTTKTQTYCAGWVSE